MKFMFISKPWDSAAVTLNLIKSIKLLGSICVMWGQNNWIALIFLASIHFYFNYYNQQWENLSSFWFCFFLGCLDTLAAMQDLKMGVANTEEETQAVMKVYSKEDYSVVNRFESMYTPKFHSTCWWGCRTTD